MITASILNENYPLKKEQIAFYKKNRFIKLKDVLDKKTLAHFSEIITKKVEELNDVEAPLESRSTYGKAFLQLFNLWTKNATIKSLIFSKRMAKIASDLMQVDGVRLYHDQALFKEAKGGITPWHSDQHYWPLQTDKTVTAWIPLQATPLDMGPLEFSAGSHKILDGRDLSISDESEIAIQKRLKVTDFKHVIEPFDAGEVSFHSGWVFHRAGANTTNDMRKVMTIIYMDKEMKLKKPSNDGQINDWNTWCPGAKVGEIINSPLNPILY
ncbi:Ectoine hydroxylase-related dioxygenase, phytanoyl-CoA dioxygenase (PhyH) family [Flaviramulus basaltis]|uniref:Ectoine hydroxylase-related dioxygenase, phytanoyl-CoA dioxygenase (PhyH) family n=1 Tax=Flaviramulus basaltis TaxID=369401 RepID=A0A1K2IME7_9FLAO|nr:phytanoyl-CoA dioxygenase family protein [Flaviramulus basaltis]SFZ93543.1 Ectoine hydroxylase-related dioxygenase, phytanoyl-CoA dioxygenase (PhyH) family [Flaviramulus basaltis]